MAAPCEWDVDPLALGVCSDWNGYAVPLQDNALALASQFLWAATGRRFGVCPLTIRPSQADQTEVAYQAFPVAPGLGGLGEPGGPFLFAGRWFNRGCATACCGTSACAIVLRGPVVAIEEVLIGADVIPASAYRVDVAGGNYLLVRIDGGCWPMCQNFTADPGEPGAFEVSYSIGVALPLSLQLATALLACEYAKHLSGGACALPARMTRLSRQGVEVEVAPPEPGEGQTGIRMVDDTIAALNPSRRQAPPMLMSPDLPEACDRRTVIPAGS